MFFSSTYVSYYPCYLRRFLNLQDIFQKKKHAAILKEEIWSLFFGLYRSVSLPPPNKESLTKHAFLRPNGLWGQWLGPSAEIKVKLKCGFLMLSKHGLSIFFIFVEIIGFWVWGGKGENILLNTLKMMDLIWCITKHEL